MMAKEWTGAAAKDFESKRTIPDKPRNILLAVGIALGLLNILGPMKLFPVCATPPAPISGAAAPVAPRADGYVQNTYTQGRALFSKGGVGTLAASTLSVLGEMEWQVLQGKMEAGTAMVPVYSDSPMLLYVISGERGAACARVECSSLLPPLAHRTTRIPRRHSLRAGHQRGRLPAGSAAAGQGGCAGAQEGHGVCAREHWSHDCPVCCFCVRQGALPAWSWPAGRPPPPQPTNQPPPACRSDTQPSVGTFRGAQTLFPLFGAQGPLASLTPDMLASALNVTAPAVAALRTKYASLPLMHKPVASPRYASPAPPARGYTWNMDADIAKTGLRTPGAGGVSVGNKTGARWGWGLLGGWGW